MQPDKAACGLVQRAPQSYQTPPPGRPMTFFLYLTIPLFILVSALLILLILIQKGRGGGLASAFGGGGGNTAFGSKTGDVLTWATSIIFGIFLLLAIILNLMARSGAKAPVAGGGGGTPAPAQQSAPAT